jgi:hypothetical protein
LTNLTKPYLILFAINALRAPLIIRSSVNVHAVAQRTTATRHAKENTGKRDTRMNVVHVKFRKEKKFRKEQLFSFTRRHILHWGA